MGLLCIDDRLADGQISLKCTHLRCLQCEPQSQLVLAECSLGFLQVGDVNDSANRAHRPSPIGRLAIVAAPLNRHPTDTSVGTHNAMYTTPSSFIACRFYAGVHGCAITFVE